MNEEQNHKYQVLMNRLSVLGEFEVAKIIQNLYEDLQKDARWGQLSNDQQNNHYLEALERTVEAQGL